MNRIIWWFYITKGFELFKTAFFLLRKKNHKINFLHIFNHSTMFPIWWIGTAYFSNGALANAALMNSFLHIVMHFYFVISSFGPSLQKFIWWKRYIVQFQMVSKKIQRLENGDLFDPKYYPRLGLENDKKNFEKLILHIASILSSHTLLFFLVKKSM